MSGKSCQYFTEPGLSFDDILRHTEEDIDVLTDLDVFNFFLRITYIEVLHNAQEGILRPTTNVWRTTTAPSRTMTTPSSYLLNINNNLLYGWTMQQYLPHGEVEWLESQEMIINLEYV